MDIVKQKLVLKLHKEGKITEEEALILMEAEKEYIYPTWINTHFYEDNTALPFTLTAAKS